MKHLRKTQSRRAAWPSLVLFSAIWAASAFPPAPDHTVYGLVRDEMGNPLSIRSAEIILESLTGTQIRTAIIPGLQTALNYRLAVPLDSGITDDLYKPTALSPSAPFRIKVRIGQTVYLPIEMRGDYSRLGQPGQSTRIDLTLGEDADGDGLPDAWERAIAAQLGGSKGLKDIRPGDDSDGDGLSNLAEYIAGTYAFDTKNGFRLQILQTTGQGAALEFMAVRGRSYSILGSSDLREWTPTQFRIPALGADASGMGSYYATDTRVLRVEALTATGQSVARYYKLVVQ
jgi:hypothetical protein